MTKKPESLPIDTDTLSNCSMENETLTNSDASLPSHVGGEQEARDFTIDDILNDHEKAKEEHEKTPAILSDKVDNVKFSVVEVGEKVDLLVSMSFEKVDDVKDALKDIEDAVHMKFNAMKRELSAAKRKTKRLQKEKCELQNELARVRRELALVKNKKEQAGKPRWQKRILD